MCYSITLRKEKTEIERVTQRTFRVPLAFQPYYHLNGFTNGNLFIVKMDQPDTIVPAMWGLVPSFGMKDVPAFQKKYNTLNAKSETIFTSNTFKHSIHDKRCLILADGFHEPHQVKGVSYPYFCHYFDDSLFCFAGLYTELEEDSYSCTILTMQANEQFEKIHNSKKRQPLVLDASLERDWLDTDLPDPALKNLIRTGFTTKPIQAYPVSRDLYKRGVNTNSTIAIKELRYPELDEQGSLF